MKKSVSFLLAAVMVLAAFSGCSSSGAASSQAASTGGDASVAASDAAGSEEGGSTGKTTIQFWHSMSGTNGDLTNQLVADFNASQDEIEVVATYQGGYADAAAKAARQAKFTMTAVRYPASFQSAAILAKADA